MFCYDNLTQMSNRTTWWWSEDMLDRLDSSPASATPLKVEWGDLWKTLEHKKTFVLSPWVAYKTAACRRVCVCVSRHPHNCVLSRLVLDCTILLRHCCHYGCFVGIMYSIHSVWCHWLTIHWFSVFSVHYEYFRFFSSLPFFNQHRCLIRPERHLLQRCGQIFGRVSNWFSSRRYGFSPDKLAPQSFSPLWEEQHPGEPPLTEG